MLFHGLPTWVGIGRACQHGPSGNSSQSSIGGHKRMGGRGGGGDGRQRCCGSRRGMQRCLKGLLCFCGVRGSSPSNMILSPLSLSLCPSAAPTEPLLCKFADGGQKKRQSQSKYPQNGRPWHREGEVSLTEADAVMYLTLRNV